jgi:hypothetical protein
VLQADTWSLSGGVYRWHKKRSTREERKPMTRNDDDNNNNKGLILYSNNNNNNNNNKWWRKTRILHFDAQNSHKHAKEFIRKLSQAWHALSERFASPGEDRPWESSTGQRWCDGKDVDTFSAVSGLNLDRFSRHTYKAFRDFLDSYRIISMGLLIDHNRPLPNPYLHSINNLSMSCNAV